MGTWSSPHTIARARALVRLMREPIVFQDHAQQLKDKRFKNLYDLVGDDLLFDVIDKAYKQDVRPFIAKRLAEWFASKFRGWRITFSPTATEILTQEVFKYGKYPINIETELLPLFIE